MKALVLALALSLSIPAAAFAALDQEATSMVTRDDLSGGALAADDEFLFDTALEDATATPDDTVDVRKLALVNGLKAQAEIQSIYDILRANVVVARQLNGVVATAKK